MSLLYRLVIRIGVTTFLSNSVSAIVFAVIFSRGLGVAIPLILSHSAYLTIYVAAAFLSARKKGGSTRFHRLYYLLACFIVAVQMLFIVIIQNTPSNLGLSGALSLLSMTATICTAQTWNLGESIFTTSKVFAFTSKIRSRINKAPRTHWPRAN